MVMDVEPRRSPRTSSFSQRSPNPVTGHGNNGETSENMFSPRFKSAAAMAGWDEDSLLLASLIVDDTPDREFKQRKRSDLTFKTPTSNSRSRKRRNQRRSTIAIPAMVLNLNEEEPQEPAHIVSESDEKQGTEERKPELKTEVAEPRRNSAAEHAANETSKKQEVNDQKSVIKTEVSKEPPGKKPADMATGTSASLPCLDKLREELSCAICLEICYEPSTTPCGHSFCKKCIRSAAEKCGKRCPKCRQLVSSGRSCTVNTVLWNTIQLLFPKEVESRKASSTSHSQSASWRAEPGRQEQRDVDTQQNNQRRVRNYTASSRALVDAEILRRRLARPIQDEDAALALRLQREEFMEVIRGEEEGAGRRRRSDRISDRDSAMISLSLARDNLRAMASRVISLRSRGRSE